MRRRELLAAALSLAALSALPRRAGALGRTPSSGKLAFTIPWPLAGLDPHDLFDPCAALFSPAVFDSLFGLDAAGDAFPTLAADHPVSAGGKTIVRLREGLATARGRPLDARDLAFSIARARGLGAYPLLGDLPVPKTSPSDPLAVVFASDEASRIARALASPLAALVPRGFSRERPDGTGAFRADPSPGRLVLTKNSGAARGAAFLDEIVIDQAPDLSASLRAFESNAADLGWLGAGLHTPRPRAVAFDAGAAAWIVLRTGSEAAAWGAPGVAQKIADALPPERLQHLGLGPMPAAAGDPGWGGPPGALLVSDGAAQLAEVARAVASIVSRAGHDIAAQSVAPAELARRRATGAYVMMLDVVRPLGGPGLAALASLTAAVEGRAGLEVFRHPPRLASHSPRSFTRTLKLGVVGELRVTGAHAPELHLAKSAGGDGWDLGATFRLARRGA